MITEPLEEQKMIKVFQWELTREEVDLVNKNGWSASEKISNYCDMMAHGAVDLTKWFHAYKHVATVDATDAEEAFALMNHWHEPDRVQKHSEFHSMSVGDIVQVGSEYFICARCGFDKVEELGEAA
jgi:hypothetical protein